MARQRQLSSSETLAILAEYMAGVPIKIIGARHGVHQSYPGMLAKRRGIRFRLPFNALQYPMPTNGESDGHPEA
jgi:hypothetical protein